MVHAFDHFQSRRVFGEEMMHHRIALSEHIITNPLGFFVDMHGWAQFTEQLAESIATQFVAKFIEFGGVSPAAYRALRESAPKRPTPLPYVVPFEPPDQTNSKEQSVRH